MTKATFKNSEETIDQRGSTTGDEGLQETDLKIFNPRVMSAEGVRGVIFTGEFISYEEVERVKKSNGRPFLSKSYKFLDSTDGSTILLNSSGLFSYLMKKKNVTPGTICQVSYGGQDDQERHNFGLIIDPEADD